MEHRRQRYALACALSVQTGLMLQELHRVARHEVDAVVPEDRLLLTACAKTYGAAASCSALAARLLLAERDELGRELGEPVRPPFKEVGVNAQEASEVSAWRATARAAAAATAELSAAYAAWRERANDVAGAVPAAVEALRGYVEAVAATLEESEPVASASAAHLTGGSTPADRPADPARRSPMSPAAHHPVGWPSATEGS